MKITYVIVRIIIVRRVGHTCWYIVRRPYHRATVGRSSYRRRRRFLFNRRRLAAEAGDRARIP